ncbi:YlxR family protein [Corynebacterium hindlerae]|uniref:YlxR family protein n=1 Tax=Corynebacterium hindlerae TaxID=699041 RepID=UPI001AD6282C|nr:YlxR family protein [Corynebacterium hindlerae]QTH58607.1 YlxR family protein [Corynebacterium hindlerae]
MTEAIRLRTCIATRQVLPDTQLLRVVLSREAGDVVVPDPERKRPGRGAWITPTLTALDTAEQRRAFGRALRVSGTPDTGPVRKYLTALVAGPEES